MMQAFLIATFLTASQVASEASSASWEKERLMSQDGVTQEDVRRAVTSGFAGSHPLLANAKPLLWQGDISGPCRTPAFVRREVRRVYEAEHFDQWVTQEGYPRNTLGFIAADSPGATPMRSAVMVSFVIASGVAGSCVYHLAAGYAVLSSAAKSASQHRRVDAERKRLGELIPGAMRRAVENVIQTCAMSDAAPNMPSDISAEALSILLASDSRDPLWRRAISSATRRLAQLPGYPDQGMDVLILAKTTLKRYPRLQTTSCEVVYGPSRPVIICAAELLAHVEAIVRLSEGPNEYFMSDAGMHELIQTVDDVGVLAQLRSDGALAAKGDQTDEHIGFHLETALIFYLAHEIGHLVDRSASLQFDGGDSALLTKRAIVKLCRQADEFRRNSFWLPGIDAMLQSGSPARMVAERFRHDNMFIEQSVDAGFVRERFADEYATDVTLAMINLSRKEEGGDAADEFQHVMVETLFVVALYDWYRDVWRFGSTHCDRFSGISDLTLCVRSVPDYQAANAVFGDTHSFTMLRAFTVIDTIVAEETPYFHGLPEDHTIWPRLDPSTTSYTVLVRMRWRFGTLQRWALLTQIVDAALKLAFEGCETGWLEDSREHPALILFDFYSLEQEVRRLTGH